MRCDYSRRTTQTVAFSSSSSGEGQCPVMHVQVADNWHPFPALPQKKRRGGGGSLALQEYRARALIACPLSRARTALSRPSSSSQYVLCNIIRPWWKTSFLPRYFSISSHMAASRLLGTRWKQNCETGCMLGRACSLIMIPRLMDTASRFILGSLNRELMHPWWDRLFRLFGQAVGRE